MFQERENFKFSTKKERQSAVETASEIMGLANLPQKEDLQEIFRKINFDFQQKLKEKKEEVFRNKCRVAMYCMYPTMLASFAWGMSSGSNPDFTTIAVAGSVCLGSIISGSILSTLANR